MDLGGSWRGSDFIVNDLMVFGVFSGVSKFKRSFRAPWTIFGGVDQCGGPLKSVGPFENLFGISVFHFEFIIIHHIGVLSGIRTFEYQ